MKIDENRILDFYAYGYELSSDDAPFPDWFEFEYEKQSCLLGYTNFDTGVILENTEIIKQIISLFNE